MVVRTLVTGLGAAVTVTVAIVAMRMGETSTLEGRAGAGGSHASGVVAAFERESYSRGERARLVIKDRSRRMLVQIFRSGPEHVVTSSDTVMNGIPVSREKTVTRRPGRYPLSVPVGRWESGLYFARLQSPDGRIGFAPFVLAPRRVGAHRVAVVFPTLTWQAYNFRDDDGDGRPDSWYAGKRRNTVRLGRAHLDRGVPYGFRYHVGFLNWLEWTNRRADYLSQWDLEQVKSSATLARAYDLIVFVGHHEYVTTQEYDLVEGYRDLGGNLMFLAANNYFWRVERDGNVLEKSGRWRDLDRPEAALIGVQYVAYQRAPRGAWIARKAPARSWLFAGTSLRPGSPFARGGVEIDQITPDSPSEIQLVADIPNLFGPGKSAQMTYYETRAGARVFAAGAFHLARAAQSDPVVSRILENLWARLTR